MNIESLREYCLSLPYATEDCAFGPEYLLFRVEDKIFGCICLDKPDIFVVKCDATLALELRERHPEIEGAWHWNKRYWNQVSLIGTLTDEFILRLIDHSYTQVVKKLPRKTVVAHPLLATISDPFIP
ncbi:MAG: MmcQ/YjbR family DNA-binding protein [Muribaculum sp.]|nr:MmcQ/YjbR family DNA-binding protein [Muribaculum sp.]